MSSETHYDWISALVDGQLTGQELQDARRNLAEDAEAQKLFAQLQSIRADLKALPELKLGTDFTDRVLQQIGTAQTSQTISAQLAVKPKATHWRMTIGIFSGVAALLLVGLVIFIDRSGDNVAVDSLNNQELAPEHNSPDESSKQNKDMPLDRAADIADQFGVDADQAEYDDGLQDEEASNLADRAAPQSDLERKALAEADADDLPLPDKVANRSIDGTQPSSAHSAVQSFGGASESLSQEVEQPVEVAEVFVARARFEDGGSVEDMKRLLNLSQLEIAQPENDRVAEIAATQEGEKFRRNEKSAEDKAEDATKDRVFGSDHTDVLVIEGPSDAVQSAVDHLVREGKLQLASDGSGALDAEESTGFPANGFFKNVRDFQHDKALGAEGFGGGGGADVAPLADDQRQKQSGGSSNKNEKRELTKTESLKLSEKANEEGGKVAGLELGDSKQSLQKGKADLAAVANGPGRGLPHKGATARYVEHGTAEFSEVQLELDSLPERKAAEMDVEGAKELSKKAQPSDETEKLPGKSRNRFTGDSEAQAGQLDQPLAEDKLVRKPQIVRLYILIDPHDTVPAGPAAPEATQENPDGN